MKTTFARYLIRARLLIVAILVPCCHMVFGGFEKAPPEPHLECPESSGKFSCNEEFLLERTADCKWIKVTDCPSAAQCDKDRGICLPCPTAGQLKCIEGVYSACSTDRSAWDTKERCVSEDFCGPGGCGDCENPGQLQCALGKDNIPEIRQCATNGRWLTVSTCPNEAICQLTRTTADREPESWDRECDYACEPNRFSCSGATLQRCSASGDSQVTVGGCASAAFCELMATEGAANLAVSAAWDRCPSPPCEAPGALRCDGNTLKRCSDDQTALLTVMVCESGKSCTTNDGGGCIVCKTGDYQCNGKILEKCGSANTWEPAQDCKSVPLCKLTDDAASGLHVGACLTPECQPEERACGTKEDPDAGGKILSRCKADLTGWELPQECVSVALCDKTRKECKPPVCETPGLRECNGQSVEECPDDRSEMIPILKCPDGRVCDAANRNQHCPFECKDEFRCKGSSRERCSAGDGWREVASCSTAALCNCALDGTCAGGVNASGCGNPICDGNLPRYRCTSDDTRLERCDGGRNAWNRSETCEAGKCFAGTAPNFRDGDCLVCEAGETRCFGGVRRTCRPDQTGWTSDSTCQHGCIENGLRDECAVCPPGGEARCFESEIRSCAENRLSFITPGTACSGACVNNGLADYCPNCTAGERQCMGSNLETCQSNQTGFGAPVTACEFGCQSVASGDDQCRICAPESTRCADNTAVQACAANGLSWGAAEVCPSRTCLDGRCTPCAPGVIECSGATRRECGSNGQWLAATSCEFGCRTNGTECRVCEVGATECTAVTPGATRLCSDAGWGAAEACPMGGPCRGSACVPIICSAGQTQCASSSSELTCGADRTEWGPPVACPSGACIAGRCTPCLPGEKRCVPDGAQTCGVNGEWLAATECAYGCLGGACRLCPGPGVQECVTASPGAFRTCSASGWTSPVDCPMGGTCSGAGECQAPILCAPVGITCVDGSIRTCSAGGTAITVEPCPAATPQCLENQCVECVPGSAVCADATSLRICSAQGSYGPPAACDPGVCLGNACVVVPPAAP